MKCESCSRECDYATASSAIGIAGASASMDVPPFCCRCLGQPLRKWCESCREKDTLADPLELGPDPPTFADELITAAFILAVLVGLMMIPVERLP